MATTKKAKQTEFTCGGCGHVWTPPKVKAGHGVSCPKCGSSDQLSSRVVTAAVTKEDDEAGSDDKDHGGSE